MGAPQSIEIDIKTVLASLNPNPSPVQKCSGARWNGLRSSNPDFPDHQLALGFWSSGRDIGHGTRCRTSRGWPHMAIRGIARSTDGSDCLKRSAPISASVARYPSRYSPLNYYISIVMKTISHYLWFLQQLGKTPAARKLKKK